MKEIGELLKTIVDDLLHLESRYLLALGIGGLCAVAVLVLSAHIEPDTFHTGAQNLAATVLVFSVIVLILAGFQRYAEQHIRTLEFTAYGHECWAHVSTQLDGRITTQIVCDLKVFNLTGETRWLTEIRLRRPKTRARILIHMIDAQQQDGNYYGGYGIPPRGNTEARGHMIVDADLSRWIDKRGIVLEIADQNKHWHTLKFPNARVDSRAMVGGGIVAAGNAAAG
jgi:hypothetical protein